MRGRRRAPFQPSSDSYRTLSLERDHPEATISRSQEGLSAQRPQDSPEPDPGPTVRPVLPGVPVGPHPAPGPPLPPGTVALEQLSRLSTSRNTQRRA